jgi:preprotein translocase subunit SecD
MVYFEKWKVILVFATCALAVLFCLPNFFNRDTVDSLPAWLPHKQISLGLDLQGGAHLLYEVDVQAIVKERVNALTDEVRTKLRSAGVGYVGLGTEGNGVGFTVRPASDVQKAREAVRNIDTDVTLNVQGDHFALQYTDRAIRDRRIAAVDQAIEIVRRRVDEMGVRESTVQRQGEDRILVQVPGVKDPAQLKELIGKTAKMTFQLVDVSIPAEEARGRIPAGSELLPGDELGPDGKPVQYLVQRRVMVSGDTLVDARASFDQNGRPDVSFKFDSVGARRFADATKANVGKPFAIVLDGKVISAPVIREPILGGSGVITGSFTSEQTNQLAIQLRAGALPAPLTILEERSVGPGMGQDSIRAGTVASIAGMLGVVVFMVVVYGLFGLFACIALVLNVLLIGALLSIIQATLTLPGIAGVVLTVGMAVDANVLIYERMREEIRNGRTPISAVDSGFQRAFGTIVDTHLTTLIAAILLLWFGSGPVRGFGWTLAIGIVTSLFTATMVTRLQVITWLRRVRPKKLPI